MRFLQLLSVAQRTNQPFHEAALIEQMLEDGSDPIEVRSRIRSLLRTMIEITESNYGKSQKRSLDCGVEMLTLCLFMSPSSWVSSCT